MAKKQVLTIREAAKEFDKSEVRIRRMVKEDRVEAKLVEIKRGEGSYQRYEITRASLEAYEASKGRRADGKRAYIFRADNAQFAKISALCAELEVEVEARYQPKKKEAKS